MQAPDTQTPDTQTLPPVAPDVTAGIVEALTPRLRKRLDAAITKLAAYPITRDGDTVHITVGDDAELTLYIPTGAVTTAEDLRCSCLLAPACVHRAAAASAAPIADPDTSAEPDTSADPGTPADPSASADPGASADRGTPPTTPEPTRQKTEQTPTAPTTTRPTPAERTAADALWTAGSAIVDAGLTGSGAVLQAALLRAAHTARLAGLHRASSAAVATATGLRTARNADPAHRLADLTASLRELLDVAHALRTYDPTTTTQVTAPDTRPGSPNPAASPPNATGGEGGHTSPSDQPTTATHHTLATLRGTTRRAYEPAGSLRLYGVFTEPILTTGGYAGAVTTILDATGKIRTIGDVAPGGADRATNVAARAIRVGDTSIDPMALTRAGLVVSGATESANGRLGAGQGVRAARAGGAAWTEDPLDRLWTVAPGDQVDRVIRARDLPPDDRPAGSDLLFLDVTVLGTTVGARDRVVAACGDLTVHLLVAHDDPAFAYRDNLRLLASWPGLRLRLIGRLEPTAERAVRVLAVGVPPGDEGPVLVLAPDRLGRIDLGLDRLHRADLPKIPQSADSARMIATTTAQIPSAPLYLMHRHVERAISGGRSVLALAGSTAGDTARLRAVGLATGAELVERLTHVAGGRERDVFGRLLPGDNDLLSRAWLAAAVYAQTVEGALTRAVWSSETLAQVR
ncbi:hypothetical protein GT354_16595 [Streptomyces sp. SID3343]|nr:hypothetical protein [Streptomyces sp. SID3343]